MPKAFARGDTLSLWRAPDAEQQSPPAQTALPRLCASNEGRYQKISEESRQDFLWHDFGLAHGAGVVLE